MRCTAISEDDYFSPSILSFSDTYPFGMNLRSFNPNEARYGFQGQEGDSEIKGQGNSWNYKFRMQDSRIGRFFTVDPLESKYPHYSPYQFSGNKVIQFVELEGLEEAKPDEKLGEKSSNNNFSYTSQLDGSRVTIEQTTTVTLLYRNPYEGITYRDNPTFLVHSTTTTRVTRVNNITGEINITENTILNFIKTFNVLQGFSSKIGAFNEITESTISTLGIISGTSSLMLSSFGKSLNNSFTKYKFGNSTSDFWYGKPHHVSVGYGINEVPSSIQKGARLTSLGSKLNIGGTVLGIGYTLYDSQTNANYGSGFGSKSTEFGLDLGSIALGARGGLPGFFVSSIYATRIKPVLKAETTQDKYDASFSYGDATLRAIKRDTDHIEQVQKLKKALIKYFNEY